MPLMNRAALENAIDALSNEYGAAQAEARWADARQILVNMQDLENDLASLDD
jgi:hypothetical protein